MAKNNSKKPTVRERINKEDKSKPRLRLRKPSIKSSKHVKKARNFGRREYNLPLPDNKVGRILSKRGRLIPRYFRESFAEMKLVTWPNRRETVRLTMAVFIFSLVFGVMVALLDVGLDKVFKELIIK